MAAISVPRPVYDGPFTNRDGSLTQAAKVFLRSVYNRVGADQDKVEAAHALASNAVPQGTEIVVAGGLQAGGALGGNVGIGLYAALGAAASLPTAGVSEGDLAYALDGLKSGESSGSGTGTPVWFSGGAWYAVWSGLGVTT